MIKKLKKYFRFLFLMIFVMCLPISIYAGTTLEDWKYQQGLGQGGSGSGGSSSSSSSGPKNSDYEKPIKEVEDERKKIEGADDSIPETEDPSSDITEAVTETEKDETLAEATEVSGEEKESENESQVIEENEKSNAPVEGDPVRLSEGSYIQNEIDLNFGTMNYFSLERQYVSNCKITSSIGYAWTTNLDERIILGLDAGCEENVIAYQNYVNKLETRLSNLIKTLEEKYHVINLNLAEIELSIKISSCDANIKKLKDLQSKANTLYTNTKDNKLTIADRIWVEREKINKLIKQIKEKKSKLQTSLNRLPSDRAVVANLESELNSAKLNLQEKKDLLNKANEIRKRNKLVMFSGMEKFYEETGFNSLTLIDGNGFPHLLYETSDGSKTWKNAGDKSIKHCEKNGSGFKVLFSDGIEKHFDEAGFLIKVFDRNKNYVCINRNTDEKILNIETSFGEKYLLSYEGNYISQIWNARYPDEKVSYSYSENKLISVTDTEGDVVSMDYDSEGHMTALKKCDGGSVLFTYGEESSDGKFLVTATTNEEGFAERFEYYKNEKRTDYIDHDGNRSSYWYDSKHHLVREKKSDDTEIINEYDSAGNLIKQTESGTTVTFDYDENGNKTRVLYTDGSSENWTYDGFNQILSCTDRDGVKEEFVRDEKGNITEYHLGDMKVFSQICNSYGQVIQRTVYGQQPIVTDYLYDNFGNLKSEVKAGIKKEYEYDSTNRLIKTKYDGKITDEYSYSNHKTIKKSSNGLETEYLTNGRKDLIKVIQKDIVTGQVHQTRIVYDKRHLPVEVYMGDGKTEELVSNYTYTPEGKLIEDPDKLIDEPVQNIQEKIYSKAGRLLSEQNFYGGWYEYSYKDGRLAASGEKDGTAVKTDYYPDGNIKTVTDRYGIVSYYNYDNRGRFTSIQNDSKKIWYEYDSRDRLISKIIGDSSDKDSSIYYINYQYAEDGRSITVTEGGKYKTVLNLDAFGNVIRQTDGNGNCKNFEYNCQNQLISQSDGYGNKTIYKYNCFGKISRIVFPDKSWISNEYNNLGKLVRSSDDCGEVYSAVYDNKNRLISERSRGESEKTYAYDQNGLVSKVSCGGETIEEYSYLNNNRTCVVKDGNGNDYVYNYDYFGRLMKEQNRKNDFQYYQYDSEGKLKSKNDFSGTTISLSQSSDRKSQIINYQNNQQNLFVYDENGNILEAGNSTGKISYRYDQGGRLVYQKDETTDEEIYFEYDKAGNRTKLYSNDREIIYSYGKNNELKEVFDNKQRLRVQLSYNKNGQEMLRTFDNGTREETLYDKAGRITARMQKNSLGEILWGEGYVYGPSGKRSATVDISGQVTLYEYNNKGQLETVWYPYTRELENMIKKEAEENGLPIMESAGENRYLSSDEKSELIAVLNSMQYALAYNLSNLQTFIKESFEYDRNGNRISKNLPYGKIEYYYDEENCLVSSGSRNQVYVNYTFDKAGNLLSEISSERIAKYAYNSQNRLIYCEVTDNVAKTYVQTTYAYDAFGRRVIVQDKGEAAIRTLYDGLTFDVIKQSPVYNTGLFTDLNESGINWGTTGKPTGDRYRYLSDEESNDGKRYFYIDDGSYGNSKSRYYGNVEELYINGIAAAKADSEYGIEYFSTDLLGSVRYSTDNYGSVKSTATYDAFGSIITGSLSTANSYGYLGKTFDPTSKLYNYGYRDYNPSISRFTTLDPIRDGPNWFSYCNADPVNFVDPDGLFYYKGNTQVAYKKTTVYVIRDNDGTGNSFDSSVYIRKEDVYGNVTYSDPYVVGANCKQQYLNDGSGSTTPDGTYYLSSTGTYDAPLYEQSDGTINSTSFKNVLSLRTSDENLSQEQRDEINKGDRLLHADEWYYKESGNTEAYNSDGTPGGAGCIINHTQEEHDRMMDEIIDGVPNPEAVSVKIYSLSNMGCTK